MVKKNPFRRTNKEENIWQFLHQNSFKLNILMIIFFEV